MWHWLMRRLGYTPVQVLRGFDSEAAGFGPPERLVEDGKVPELIEAILEGRVDIAAHCQSYELTWRKWPKTHTPLKGEIYFS